MLKSISDERYHGFEIDYSGLEQDLIVAVRQEYSFTKHQATYLVGQALQEEHESFYAKYYGIIEYLREICELFKNLPKD